MTLLRFRFALPAGRFAPITPLRVVGLRSFTSFSHSYVTRSLRSLARSLRSLTPMSLVHFVLSLLCRFAPQKKVARSLRSLAPVSLRSTKESRSFTSFSRSCVASLHKRKSLVHFVLSLLCRFAPQKKVVLLLTRYTVPRSSPIRVCYTNSYCVATQFKIPAFF